MKEVSSSTWVFQIIILFILIFVAFLALTISYFKVFMIKNETLTIIEKYERMDSESISIINNYVGQKSYNTKSKCPDGWSGVDSLSSNNYDKNRVPNKKYLYCFRKNNDNTHYEIIFFYKFNLPVLGELGVFEIKGKTSKIKMR